MTTVLHPWQILVAAMAGLITRQQDAAIEYLREENSVLNQQLGRERLRLTDDQRRRLAALGKALGRRAHTDIASLVTPDTILRSHRQKKGTVKYPQFQIGLGFQAELLEYDSQASGKLLDDAQQLVVVGSSGKATSPRTQDSGRPRPAVNSECTPCPAARDDR